MNIEEDNSIKYQNVPNFDFGLITLLVFIETYNPQIYNIYAVLWLVFMCYPYLWSPVGITLVLTTFWGYYPCVYYFYVPWLIMTSQCLMTLLGMPHCSTTMGNDVARDIHCDATCQIMILLCQIMILLFHQ